MKTKPELKISCAAAVRLFLRLAALPVPQAAKADLIEQLSSVISGQMPPESIDFSLCGEAAEELRSDLLKSIRRSASARAAAVRRKQRQASGDQRHEQPVSPPCDPYSGCTAYIYNKLPRSEWMVFDSSQVCIAMGYGSLPPKYSGCRRVYRGHFDDSSKAQIF